MSGRQRTPAQEKQHAEGMIEWGHDYDKSSFESDGNSTLQPGQTRV
jgi:hypothetical protein